MDCVPFDTETKCRWFSFLSLRLRLCWWLGKRELCINFRIRAFHWFTRSNWWSEVNKSEENQWLVWVYTWYFCTFWIWTCPMLARLMCTQTTETTSYLFQMISAKIHQKQMFARNGVCLLQCDIITVSLFVCARKLKTFSRRLFTQKNTFCFRIVDAIELNWIFRCEEPEGDTDLETTFGVPLRLRCRVLVCGRFVHYAHWNKNNFINWHSLHVSLRIVGPFSITIYSHHVHDPLTSFALLSLSLLLAFFLALGYSFMTRKHEIWHRFWFFLL